jgi:hypothetical protein
MVVTSGQAVDGAKTGAIIGAGTLLMGPTLGAPAAGVAANYFSDSNTGRTYAVAGMGVGMLSLFLGGSGGGSGGSGRSRK